jgi:hypothetical protein
MAIIWWRHGQTPGEPAMNGWHEAYNDFPGPDVMCGHLIMIAVPSAPADPPAACQACLDEGTTWVQLRRCLVCGQTSCCESSRGATS